MLHLSRVYQKNNTKEQEKRRKENENAAYEHVLSN